MTFHKYIKATSFLNWVASLIIQHGDQLCDTSFIFMTVSAEDALATSQLKPLPCLTTFDNSADTSPLPLLQIAGLVASAASLPLLAPATICTDGAASCLSQRTLPGSR